jgi:hypothetical protein
VASKGYGFIQSQDGGSRCRTSMQPGLSTNTPMVHPGIATQPYRLVMAFSDAPAYRLPASITRRQAELSRRLFALSERVQGTFRDRVLIQTRYSVAKPTDSRSRESVSKPPAPPRGAALRPDSRTLAVGTSYSTYTLRCSGCSVGVTMTAGHFNDPEHWRQQADEARAIARQLPNPESKAVMMRIAADYDRAGAG